MERNLWQIWVTSALAIVTMMGWTVNASASDAPSRGVVLEYGFHAVTEDLEWGPGVEHLNMRLDIEGDDVLVTFSSPEGAEATSDLPPRLLYLDGGAMLVLLDDQTKTLSRADPEILAMLGRHLDQKDTDVRVRLLELPGQPRQVMANVLEDDEASRQSRRGWRPWETISTGTWEERAGHRSLGYEVEQGGNSVGRLWVTPMDPTPVTAEHLGAVRRAGQLTDALLEQASQVVTTDPQEIFGFHTNPLAPFAFQHGVPVQLTLDAAAGVKYEKILEAIRERQGEDPPVEIPSGYRQRTLGPQ